MFEKEVNFVKNSGFVLLLLRGHIFSMAATGKGRGKKAYKLKHGRLVSPFIKEATQKGQSKEHCMCIKQKQNTSPPQSFLHNPSTLKSSFQFVWTEEIDLIGVVDFFKKGKSIIFTYICCPHI